MEIQLGNRQAIRKINSWTVKRLIKTIALFLNVEVDDISILFCEDLFLRGLNAEYFNRDVVTDVISFPLNDFDDEGIVSGEMLISVERAVAVCKKYNSSESEEICLYIIHAFLHLMGYHDSPESERKKMKKVENKVLEYIKSNTDCIVKLFR